MGSIPYGDGEEIESTAMFLVKKQSSGLGNFMNGWIEVTGGE